jgi:receptor protein-tyrosine kinase
MSIIEQATKRLEQLERAGVTVPWSAARIVRNPAPPHPSNLREPGLTAPALQGPPKSNVLVSSELRHDTAASQGVAESARAIVSRPELQTTVTLDIEQLREAGYLVPDQVRSEMAEQFRHLKRPLLKNARAEAGAQDHRGSQIMITSAMPGEGKTFCSINLAMSMAMEIDTAVILVDADVVRPSVFARLGINARPIGLLDLLNSEELMLEDALVATNVPKLTLLAAGVRSERSTELLASAGMDRLLARLAKEYADHIVIFDAPPLLLTTESSVLASKVGQVVVIVEASKTPRDSIRRAFAALCNCPVVMSVLNKGEDPSDGHRYGYYYG